MRAGPLSHAPFRWLVAARTTTILGNAVAPLALAFALLDLTGSATDLGLVVAARSVANVAVLLIGGVIADRLPRNVVLVGTSLAAGLTQGIVAAVVITGSATVPLLVVLSTVNGAVAALSMPASSALVPQTVPPEQLRPANAILRLGVNGGSIVGASLGSVLVAVFGPGIGLAIDAASFFVAAGLFARLHPDPATDAPAPGNAARTSVLHDLLTGWREFTRRRWVWIVVVQFMLVNAASVGAIAVLGPIVADATFGRAAWGLVLASETVGFVLGGLIALRWHPRHALGIGVALTGVCAVPVLLLAALPLIPVLIGAFLLGGMAIEQFGIAWDQSLQQNIPADRLSRVYSYDAAGSFIAIPLGEVLVGPLAGNFGTTPIIIGCAVIIAAASPAAALTRSVRTLTSGTHASTTP